jgi:hypothetical protein
MSALEWQKSSFSSGNPDSDCIEVASIPGTSMMSLRESDDPTVSLTSEKAPFQALLAVLKYSNGHCGPVPPCG